MIIFGLTNFLKVIERVRGKKFKKEYKIKIYFEGAFLLFKNNCGKI